MLIVSVLGPLAVPKFGRILSENGKWLFRKVKGWRRHVVKLVLGREDHKIYVKPIGSLAQVLQNKKDFKVKTGWAQRDWK